MNPMWSVRRLLTLVCLAIATVCPAAVASDAAPAPVRLTAPLQGTTLAAGALAPLAWEPLGPFAQLDRVEEWEAFLSLDGGAHYPFRITPHLDRGLRHVLWRVPDLPTHDARLLLRFGDEQRETAVELPERFVIAGASTAFTSTVFAHTVTRASAPGEPARPGDPGVAAWVEGARDGSGLRMVVAAASTLHPVRSAGPTGHREPALVPQDPEPDPAPSLAQPTGTLRVHRRPTATSAVSAAWASCPPILLLIQRQNE